MKRAVLIAAIPTSVLLLAGCAGQPAEESPATPMTTEPSALSGFLCSPDENGVWRGKARLTNIGAATNTYTVRFSVVRTQSQEVVGMKEATFTVAPGDSTDVAFPDIHTGNASGLECVPRVTAVPAPAQESPQVSPGSS